VGKLGQRGLAQTSDRPDQSREEIPVSSKGQATSEAFRKSEFAALYRFTDRLYRARSPADIYEGAFDAIACGLGCERASILLFDASGALKFVAWRGLSEAYRQAVEGHSPWTRDTTDPQPIHVADIDEAEIDQSLRKTVKAEGIAALAFIPLVANGALVGKFMTYYAEPHVFNSAENDLALTIARQLGFSIERMRAEDVRQRAEEASRLLTSIVENSSDAIISKDLNGTVTSWNRAAERIFGYSAEDMIGQPILKLIPDDRHDEETVILERVRRGEQVAQHETVRQHQDGRLIDVSLTISPVKEARGRIIGASTIARDITDRKHAQARQELLTRELHHRTKNLFAVVHSVAARSFAGKQTLAEAEEAVLGRLQSLAKTHSMLIETEWQGADLRDLVNAALSPYPGRVKIEGPRIALNEKAAQNFCLALHELATNAAKYGALSNGTGHVHVSWSVFKNNGSGLFTLRWQERDGPAVKPPKHAGFGSVVLERVMAEYFDAPSTIEFEPAGVRYELHGSVDAVTVDAPEPDEASRRG
jgi:PAS domain S-box-containing protein